jgi:hypothetical protein
MKVAAVTIPNCPKCVEAKERLGNFPIAWIDYRYAGPQIILSVLGLPAPAFVIDDNGSRTVTTSILKVKKLFEEAEGKQE